MTGAVGRNDRIAGTQGRNRLGWNPTILPFNAPSITHGASGRSWRRAPERRVVDKALPAWGPPGGSGHVGLDRGLLYESKPFQVVGHEGPALCDPDVAQVGHVLALLFKGLQVLFHASARECAAPAKQGCGGS